MSALREVCATLTDIWNLPVFCPCMKKPGDPCTETCMGQDLRAIGTVPPPLVLPRPLSFPRGVGDRHLVNPKSAKPLPKGAVQSIPVESGEHVQELKVKWSRTKKFYT